MLSDIGEGIAEVEIVRWLVSEGDRVRPFDPLVEVQSDKAAVEITSRYEGVVRRIPNQSGEIVRVGQPLCYIEESARVGAAANADAPHAPTGDASAAAASMPTVGGNTRAATPMPPKPLTTPAVRHWAARMHVDLSQVPPSGPHGRILKEDVLRYVEQREQQESVAASATPPPPGDSAGRRSSPIPGVTPPASLSGAWLRIPQQRDFPVLSEIVHQEPIRGLRRAMVKSMTAAAAVPHLGYGEEVLVDKLVALREQLTPQVTAAYQLKLTFMPFFLKATSLALSAFPILNASLDHPTEPTTIRYHKDHNISVAMDTPHGLIVPNVKSVQERTVVELAAELARLQSLARAGKLGENDLGGGTFALSNIGSIGGIYTAPMIMVPQVAIGAIGRIRRLPRYADEEGGGDAAAAEEVRAERLVPRHVLTVTFAADHRIIDGATIANFCTLWKRFVQSPAQMLLELK